MCFHFRKMKIFIDWNVYWWAAEVCNFFFCGHKMKKEWRNLFKVYHGYPNQKQLVEQNWGKTVLVPIRYHYACRMNLVFCPVFKLRHLSFQKKSLKGFSAIRSQVGNASVFEALVRNKFDNFMFWSLVWSKLFYDHLLATRFFNLETEKDFLGAIWCLHQKVNFGTCNKLSIELCLQKKLLFNYTKNVALLEGLCYTILPEWK